MRAGWADSANIAARSRRSFRSSMPEGNFMAGPWRMIRKEDEQDLASASKCATRMSEPRPTLQSQV